LKKLENDIFTKIFILFVITLVSILGTLFFFLKIFTEKIVINSVDSISFMDEFYAIWLWATLFIFLLLVLLFIIVKKTKKRLMEDVMSLNKYLQNISEDKKYDAILEIKHYFEFLHISIILKNIVKRLHTKSKKK